MDIAPSILALLDCPVPPDLDGQVLDSILEVKAITSDTAQDSIVEPETVYSAAEEAEVEDRLRNLGYL